MILFLALRKKDISVLSDRRTLYILDYRALGESFDYEIKSMWKYENLLPWIVNSGFCTVNENYIDIDYNKNKNRNFLVLKKSNKASDSVVKRLKNKLDFSLIDKIWTAVAHPDIDKLAEINQLNLNYKYEDFCKYNNKIQLKEKMGDLSPDWQEIKSFKHLKEIWEKQNMIVKRDIGAGGFTTFLPENKEIPQKLIELYDLTGHKWFAEQIICSTPMSIQCYKDKSGDIKVFGISEQIIQNNTEFIGAKFLKLDYLDKDLLLKSKIIKTLEVLSKHIKDYTGFFGIDFFYDSEKNYYFIEANIRLTAMTIPTLLHNEDQSNSSTFYEDYDGDLSKAKKILTKDHSYKTFDVLV